MIIDHSNGLHMGVKHGRTQELESPFLQIFRPKDRFRALSGVIIQAFKPVDPGLSGDPGPHVAGKVPKFPADLEESLGVMDGGEYFGPVTDDALILQQPADLAGPETGDFLEIKPGKILAEILAFIQNRPPGKTRLERFQNQELENFPVVMDRNAPFLVMVPEHKGIVLARPGTTG